MYIVIEKGFEQVVIRLLTSVQNYFYQLINRATQDTSVKVINCTRIIFGIPTQILF